MVVVRSSGHGYDEIVQREAERLAEIGGVEVPSESDLRKYGAYGAVAHALREKMDDEPLVEVARRNLSPFVFDRTFNQVQDS